MKKTPKEELFEALATAVYFALTFLVFVTIPLVVLAWKAAL